MTAPNSPRKRRPPRLSLHPLKAEEALRLFMQVDPGPVEKGLRKLARKRRKPSKPEGDEGKGDST